MDAIDVDSESIETARRNVTAAALADEVTPTVHDAGDPELSGSYDLVTTLEALHAMDHPVPAHCGRRDTCSPREAASSLATSAWRSISTPPAMRLSASTMALAFSTAFAVGNLDDDSAATGTVIRPDTVRAYHRDRVRTNRRAPNRARLLALLPVAAMTGGERITPGTM
jgi:hypothetical protein